MALFIGIKSPVSYPIFENRTFVKYGSGSSTNNGQFGVAFVELQQTWQNEWTENNTDADDDGILFLGRICFPALGTCITGGDFGLRRYLQCAMLVLLVAEAFGNGRLLHDPLLKRFPRLRFVRFEIVANCKGPLNGRYRFS